MSRLRILVAEDDGGDQNVIGPLLSKLGHQIDNVYNGLEVISAMLRSSYDLVFMDVRLPEMDGVESTRIIRSLPGPESAIPIIAVAATKEQRQSCLDAGMNDHVAMPIIEPDFLQTIAKWTVPAELDQGPGQQSAEGEDEDEDEDENEVSSSVIDKEILSELANMVSWDAMPRLFEELERDCAERGEIMARAAEAGDFGVLGKQAHTLKSTLGQFGAVEAQQIALDIDALCKSGDDESARRLVAQFLQKCDQAMFALRQELMESAPARGHGA